MKEFIVYHKENFYGKWVLGYFYSCIKTNETLKFKDSLQAYNVLKLKFKTGYIKIVEVE